MIDNVLSASASESPRILRGTNPSAEENHWFHTGSRPTSERTKNSRATCNGGHSQVQRTAISSQRSFSFTKRSFPRRYAVNATFGTYVPHVERPGSAASRSLLRLCAAAELLSKALIKKATQLSREMAISGLSAADLVPANYWCCSECLTERERAQ